MAHTRLTLLLAFTLACSSTVMAAGQAPESGSSSPDATAREESPYGAQLQEILDQHEEEWRHCVEASSQVMKNALETSTASAEGRQEDVTRLQKEIVPLRKQLGECGKIKEAIVAEMRETGAPDDALDGAWRAFSESLQEGESPAEPRTTAPGAEASSDEEADATAEASAYEPGPLNIYIFGETKQELDKAEKKRLKKQLKKARAEAKDARKALKKELKTKYGKNSKDWPEDERERSDKAFYREELAALDYHLVDMKPKEVPDSVDNMRRALEEAIDSDRFDTFVEPRLVNSREEADILIEMLTRRSRFGPAWHLYLKVTPHEWLAPEQLSELSLRRARDTATGMGILWVLVDYGEQGPYWIVEIEQVGGAAGWMGVASFAVMNLVRQFDIALQELDEVDEEP